MFARLAVCLSLIPATGSADVWSFATPSNNIECWVGESSGGSDIECTIFQKSGTPPVPRPAGCTQGWGHVYIMDQSGPVSMVCKTVASAGQGAQSVAEYGVQGKFGGFVCDSSRQGLECRNLDGHGFFLSRASQRAF